MGRTCRDTRRCKPKAARVKPLVPRPPNCFFVFRAHKAKELRNQGEAVGCYRTQSDISKMLGVMWKDMSKEDKQYYVDLAQEAKEKHKKAYPDYRYQPAKRRRRVKTECELEEENYADSELDAEFDEDYEEFKPQAGLSVKGEPSMVQPQILYAPRTIFRPLGQFSMPPMLPGVGQYVLDTNSPLPATPIPSTDFHGQPQPQAGLLPQYLYNPWLYSGPELLIPPYNANFFDYSTSGNAFNVSGGSASTSTETQQCQGGPVMNDDLPQSDFISYDHPAPSLDSSLLFAPESNSWNLMQLPDPLATLPQEEVCPSPEQSDDV